MDSEIETTRRKTRVPSSIPQASADKTKASSILDSIANDNDVSIERETINTTDLLIDTPQKVEPTQQDEGGKAIDDAMQKMAKRVSRHRLELDQLNKIVGKINKRSRNILIDQNFIDRIGAKLGEKFASKQEVTDLTKVVKVLSTDINELIKSLKKSNEELAAVMKQSQQERKDEVLDAVASEDEGEIVASGTREINPNESDDESIKTFTLRPLQNIVDKFSETEDVAPSKEIELENQTYNFIYSI
jgi:hypothetical protein